MNRPTFFAITGVLLLSGLFYFYSISNFNSNSKSSFDSHSNAKSSEHYTREPKSPARKLAGSKPDPRTQIVAGQPSRKSTVRIKSNQDVDSERAKKDQWLNGSLPMPSEDFVLVRMRAIPEGEYRPELGEKVGASFGFVMYADESVDGRIVIDQTRPVVAQKSSGRLGIVTGTIIVKLREPSLASPVAQSHDLKLRYEEPDVRRAYYSAPALSPLDDIVKSLRLDPNVEKADLEIIQGKKKF